jgi:hypothetical protein
VKGCSNEPFNRQLTDVLEAYDWRKLSMVFFLVESFNGIFLKIQSFNGSEPIFPNILYWCPVRRPPTPLFPTCRRRRRRRRRRGFPQLVSRSLRRFGLDWSLSSRGSLEAEAMAPALGKPPSPDHPSLPSLPVRPTRNRLL